MNADQSILVGTDFSEPAAVAVERAACLAQEWRCPLNILHVFNPFDWQQASQLLPDILLGKNPIANREACLDSLRADIVRRYDLTKASSKLITAGRASVAIDEQARAIGAGLTVIGVRGEGIVQELALGGTAIKVLRRSPCAVLVVRQKPDQAYRRIALSTDFSATAARALHVSFSMFPQAGHIAIHASRAPYEGHMRLAGASSEDIDRYRADELASAHRSMDAYLAQADHKPAGGISRVIRHGYPATVLRDELSRAPCDLLVLGRHGQSVLDEQLLGSITLNLLYHAPCDVLLVP